MEVTLSEKGGATWRFEYIYQVTGDLVIWVAGMHWPGCDDESGHEPVALGEIRTGGEFQMANRPFWESVGIDTAPVFDAVARMLASGDPGDVLGIGDDSGSERELP